jgi:hypothetical protein
MPQEQNFAAKGSKGASAARRAATVASKAGFTAIPGGEAAARKAKDNMDELISQSTKVVEEVLSSSAKEAKKAQETALEIGRESFENLTKSADAALKNLGSFADIGKETADAAVESATLAGEVTQSISSEIADMTNSLIAEQFKAVEKFLACKTVTDIFNLQTSYLKNNVDNVFSRALKLAELSLEYSNAAEPLNESAARAGEKIAKAFSTKK